MAAMSAFRAVPRAASCGWLRTAAVTSRARQFSSGEHFLVYHDANCAVCNSVVETLVSADAPYKTMSFLKKSPKEDALLQVARVLQGGAELMLQDNSWPRVTDPKEVRARPVWHAVHILQSDGANAMQIASVCANNPGLMQRPIVVAPDGASAVTVPLAAHASELDAWINAQSFTKVSEKQVAEEAEAAQQPAAAAGGSPPVDSFYSSMSHGDDAADEQDDEDLIPGSVDDAAEALKNMVTQMPESELRSAAEMMELGDLEGLDRDSLSTEELREIVLAAISSAVAR